MVDVIRAIIQINRDFYLIDSLLVVLCYFTLLEYCSPVELSSLADSVFLV